MKSMSVLLTLTVLLWSLADATILVASGATVTAASAYSAVALAGVVGLALGAGVVGAGALSKRGRFSRRRGRRDVALVRQEDMLFDVVAASDAYGCALKLVCEIEARSDSQLQADDESILNLFGRHPSAVAEDNIATARQAFFYAANLGVNQGADACQKVFHTCRYSYEQMMSYVRALRG